MKIVNNRVISALILLSFIGFSPAMINAQTLSDDTSSNDVPPLVIPNTLGIIDTNSEQFIPTEREVKSDTFIWRATIVSIGSLPFTLFYSNVVADLTRYTTSGFNPLYAPWPFKDQYSIEVTSDEKMLRLGIALGASALLGIVDALVTAQR